MAVKTERERERERERVCVWQAGNVAIIYTVSCRPHDRQSVS